MAGPRLPRRLRKGSTASSVGAAKPPPTLKRLIWTGAFAAATISATIYGAGLKTQHDYESTKKEVREATPEERIKLLEGQRSEYMAQRIPLDLKLQKLEARIKANEEQEEAAKKLAAQKANAKPS